MIPSTQRCSSAIYAMSKLLAWWSTTKITRGWHSKDVSDAYSNNVYFKSSLVAVPEVEWKVLPTVTLSTGWYQWSPGNEGNSWSFPTIQVSLRTMKRNMQWVVLIWGFHCALFRKMSIAEGHEMTGWFHFYPPWFIWTMVYVRYVAWWHVENNQEWN